MCTYHSIVAPTHEIRKTRTRLDRALARQTWLLLMLLQSAALLMPGSSQARGYSAPRPAAALPIAACPEAEGSCLTGPDLELVERAGPPAEPDWELDAPACASRRSRVEKVSARSFGEEVLGSRGPVLVDFSAPWCIPCRRLDPSLRVLARDLGPRLAVRRVNVGPDRALAASFDVRSVPTLILFEDGEVRWRSTGASSEPALRRILTGLLERSAEAIPPASSATRSRAGWPGAPVESGATAGGGDR